MAARPERDPQRGTTTDVASIKTSYFGVNAFRRLFLLDLDFDGGVVALVFGGFMKS
jgi:hypothetical protein